MIRKAFIMTVNPGAEDEYARRHQPIWPELTRVLEAHGVHHYHIYLDRETRALFAHVEFENEERFNAVAQDEVCQRWWRYMSDIMPANEDCSPVRRDLEEVFRLK